MTFSPDGAVAPLHPPPPPQRPPHSIRCADLSHDFVWVGGTGRVCVCVATGGPVGQSDLMMFFSLGTQQSLPVVSIGGSDTTIDFGGAR